jgi:glycerol kinase
MLAAVGAGIYPSLEAATAMIGETRTFTPQLTEARREQRLGAWAKAIERR